MVLNSYVNLCKAKHGTFTHALHMKSIPYLSEAISAQILPRSRECRRKQDDCDLAEYCDGERTTCPEDVFAVNGLPCDGGVGYCYNSQCPQRPDQCVKLYGSCECLCYFKLREKG